MLDEGRKSGERAENKRLLLENGRTGESENERIRGMWGASEAPPLKGEERGRQSSACMHAQAMVW